MCIFSGSYTVKWTQVARWPKSELRASQGCPYMEGWKGRPWKDRPPEVFGSGLAVRENGSTTRKIPINNIHSLASMNVDLPVGRVRCPILCPFIPIDNRRRLMITTSQPHILQPPKCFARRNRDSTYNDVIIYTVNPSGYKT